MTEARGTDCSGSDPSGREPQNKLQKIRGPPVQTMKIMGSFPQRVFKESVDKVLQMKKPLYNHAL